MAFDFNYVNSFKLHADQNGNPIGFLPDKDTDPTGAVQAHGLGDMQGATTVNIDWGYGPGTEHPGEDGGLIVAFTNGTGQSVSETIYVVNPHIFNSAPNLVAELEFDSPQAIMADGTPNTTTWSVVLNFKTGNESDGGKDEPRIGPRFTFVEGGGVFFRGTDQPDMLHPAGTSFKLVVSIQRTETTFESGAMGFLDDAAFIGVSEDKYNFLVNLAAARTAPAKITAVGVTVVNSGQDMQGNSQPPSKVSVHLIAFRLFWDYQKLEREIRI